VAVPMRSGMVNAALLIAAIGVVLVGILPGTALHFAGNVP
jgi:hypothetical protein